MPRPCRRVRLEAGLSLRLPQLMRQGFIVPGTRTSAKLRWTYTGTDIETGSANLWADLTAPTAGTLDIQLSHFRQQIDLRSQPRHFGGRQWYFECPRTGRLVTSLWLPNGARRFASRHAWPRQVAYSSQFQAPHQRALKRAFRIREQLHPSPAFHGIGDILPPKPKHMRWATYEKILEMLDHHEAICDAHTVRLMVRFTRLV